MRFGLMSPTAGALTDPKPSDVQKADVYQWVLGRKASGDTVVGPSAQAETPREFLNLYEVARLIRGTGNTSE